MLDFILSRLSEKSTWTALASFAGAAGLWHMSTNSTETMISAGLAIVAALQAFLKEKGSA